MQKAKSPADPRVKEFIDYAYDTYKKLMGVGLVINGGADGMCVKRLLNAVGELDTLKFYWNFFLKYRGRDFFLNGATRDIQTFSSRQIFNRIVQLASQAGYRPISPADAAKRAWEKVLIFIRNQDILREMRGEAGREKYESDLDAVTPQMDNDVFLLIAPSDIIAMRVQEQYGEDVSEALEGRRFEIIERGRICA